jgi:nucleoside-diphosphate-sugar epimerase
MSNTEKKVIVFGATGAVGTALINLLSQQQPQWQVLAVTRNKSSAASKFPPSTKVVEGDVEDLPRVLELTKDVDIIYSCVGFPKYERKYWAKHWPIVVDNLLQAVVDGGSKKQLIFCDNLYAYGFDHDEPKMSTSTTTVAPSLKSKPAIRAVLRQSFTKHMQDHPHTLAVVGGADFFGPGVTDKSFLGDTFTGKLVQGQTPLCMGSSKVIHDFCYVPDFANAMYISSIDQRALDHFWICPHAVHDKTLQDLANDMKAVIDNGSLDQSNSATNPVKIQVLSKGLIGFLGLFMGFMAEVKEMMDSWTKPYRIDDSEFCTTFDVQATPYEEALTEYVQFFKNKVNEQKKK